MKDKSDDTKILGDINPEPRRSRMDSSVPYEPDVAEDRDEATDEERKKRLRRDRADIDNRPE